LNDGFQIADFTARTGLPAAELETLAAERPRLLDLAGGRLRCTDMGRRHLDTLLTELLPAAA
jgi:hypothetical protein